MYVCDAEHTEKLKKPKQPRKPIEHFYLYSLHSRTPTELNGYFSYASESKRKRCCIRFSCRSICLTLASVWCKLPVNKKNYRAMLEHWNVSS